MACPICVLYELVLRAVLYVKKIISHLSRSHFYKNPGISNCKKKRKKEKKT